MTKQHARPTTLTGFIQYRAAERPTRTYARYIFPDKDPIELTFADMERRTREFAGLYAAKGVVKGDAVIIIMPHHEDLMPAFMGATWLGAIPAFLPTLTAKLDPDRYYKNLGSLFASTKPTLVVTYPELRDELTPKLRADNNNVPVVAFEDATAASIFGDPVEHASEDVALIQYSSGSTGLQKGAALSHRAVLAEIKGVGDIFELSDADSFATWVPLYHDWGLFCIALHALELGTDYTLMDPMHWVTDPAAIFRVITQYKNTYYCHPNFAFNFMTRRITDEQMKGVDLSSLRICSNGAEPCFYEDHEMFAKRFAQWGFKREALAIVYGMAEVTNSVFAAGHKEPIKIDPISRDILQRTGEARPADADDPAPLRMLGAGRALTGTEFRIVDDAGEVVGERIVGEIEIKSRAAFHGYFRNPEATAKVDHDGWYVTNDLGYRVGETLFVTGRKSDIIILSGVNIYPQDIEKLVGEHPDVVAGRVAAVGVDDESLGTQRLALIIESRSTDPKVHRSIADFARKEIMLQLGVTVDEIHHAPYSWLIKTSSGKIARLPNYRRLTELQADSKDKVPDSEVS